MEYSSQIQHICVFIFAYFNGYKEINFSRNTLIIYFLLIYNLATAKTTKPFQKLFKWFQKKRKISSVSWRNFATVISLQLKFRELNNYSRLLQDS